MDALMKVLAGAIGCGGGMVVLSMIFLLLSIGDGRTRRWVRRHPVAPCAALHPATRLPARFAVYGRAVPGPSGMVVAPLSGEPAVWFRTEVVSTDRTGRTYHVVTLYRESGGDPFGVADHSGVAAVSGSLLQGATTSGDFSHWRTSDKVDGPKPTRLVVNESYQGHGPRGPWLQQALDRGVIREHQLSRRRSLEIAEEILPAGVPVHVIGEPAVVAEGVFGLKLPRSGRFLLLGREPAETDRALASDRTYLMGCAGWLVLVGVVLLGLSLTAAFALPG